MIITAKDIIIYSYLNHIFTASMFLLVGVLFVMIIIVAAISSQYDYNDKIWINLKNKMIIPIIIFSVAILILLICPSPTAFKRTLINKYQIETQVPYDTAEFKVEQILGIR